MTWYAAIVGVDDGGPYEVFGPDETDSVSPQGAFESVHGFWDEVQINDPSLRKLHIRVFQEEDYVYAWDPKNPTTLQAVYAGEDINLDEKGA